MGSQLEEQTRAAIPRCYRWTGTAAFEELGRRFQDEIFFMRRAVMTGEAIPFENWKNFVLKIDGLGAFERGDLNRWSGYFFFRLGRIGAGEEVRVKWKETK